MIPWERLWYDFIEVLLWIPRKIFELVMAALAALIQAIPVPDFVNQIPSLFSSLPQGVLWGFYLFNFAAGVAIIVSAYVIRFLIRRIPIIG